MSATSELHTTKVVPTSGKLTIVDKIEAILEDQNKELAQIKAIHDSLRARQKTVQKMLIK